VQGVTECACNQHITNVKEQLRRNLVVFTAQRRFMHLSMPYAMRLPDVYFGRQTALTLLIFSFVRHISGFVHAVSIKNNNFACTNLY